jgi:threonine/homoserine/homoserine lactone efflux protein
MMPVAAGLFLVSAFAMLGSPGPGIAALLAVGRLHGFVGSLRYFAGLQVGLAIAAALCASGLASVLSASPGVTTILTLGAIVYLAWLAWTIAMSPVGTAGSAAVVPATFPAGFFLGISNPKAYLAFVTLFASQTLVSGSRASDAVLKWALTITVIIIVDVAWLYAGGRLGRVSLSPRADRCTNVALGLSILVVAIYSLWELAVS